MPNWKNIVEKQNAEAYKFPEGWSTREQVADDLECSVERVAQILAPGLRNGTIERGDFTVWDRQLKRTIRITGYRECKPKDKKEATSPNEAPKGIKAKIIAYAKARPHMDASEICRKFRINNERAPAKLIRDTLAEAGLQ